MKLFIFEYRYGFYSKYNAVMIEIMREVVDVSNFDCFIIQYGPASQIEFFPSGNFRRKLTFDSTVITSITVIKNLTINYPQ